MSNMYYAQFDSFTEEEPFYDSGNSDTYYKLMNSPSQAEFHEYMQKRNYEEFLHKHWMLKLYEQKILAEDIKKECGMAVSLADERVCYIYKPAKDRTRVQGIKFKITLVYVKLLRKWYISLARSRLPSIINLDNILQNGIYDPVGSKILKIVHKVKDILDVFVKRLEYMYEVIDSMKELYKDIEFELNEFLTHIKVILKEKGWPKGIEKTSKEDIITLEIDLNANLETINLAYEYLHNKNMSKIHRKKCISKLERRLQIFFDLPLKEALKTFIH
ncbi:uncharacterized protein LOC143425828 [Xylocopa sonorina]|uniref:uncharacterized protein LOC143425828 n=1 Tax=Xylocopa sonorina TaxID=1818115 RepID=UPI00403B2FD9